MPQFIVERNMPGAGELDGDSLTQLSRRWSAAADALGPTIQWLHSYVVEDRVVCVFRAADIELVREHAFLAGLGESRIEECVSTILPRLAA